MKTGFLSIRGKANDFLSGICLTMRPLLLLVWLLPTALQAQYSYTTNNGGITITKYYGFGGEVVIPGMIDGLPVTSVGSMAFQNTGLTTLVIPNTMTNIGDRAFQRCIDLSRVAIPYGVATIGAGAFAGCVSLTNVTIPGSVTSIGAGPFEGCASLNAIWVDPLNSFYSDLDGVLFDKRETTLLEYPAGRTGSYTTAKTVSAIGSYAFSGSSVTGVTVTAPSATIGDHAFENCLSLTSIAIAGSVTNIEDYAFLNCRALESIYFEGTPPEVGLFVFGPLGFKATVYCLPGTTGWEPTFHGLPTALWLLPNPLILNNGSAFGIQTNGFNFTISWATNTSVIVEATATLAHPKWTPVATNTLSDGLSHFSAPEWTNAPIRFYRLRSR